MSGAELKKKLDPYIWASCCSATFEMCCQTIMLDFGPNTAIIGDQGACKTQNAPQGLNLSYFRCQDQPWFSGVNGAYLFQGADHAFLTDLQSQWDLNTTPEAFNVTNEFYNDRADITPTMTIGNISSGQQYAAQAAYGKGAMGDQCAAWNPGMWGKSPSLPTQCNGVTSTPVPLSSSFGTACSEGANGSVNCSSI